MKPVIHSEDDARAAVAAWRDKPEHIHPKPGQEQLTASDDVDAPEHNEKANHPVTDPKDEP